MNPADKRLAVRTEDHPLEYAKFEGVIPPGQYGAGTVMVWDLGEYESPENQPIEEQLARGKIHVALHGEKLRGAFALVKIERVSSSSSRGDYWLLIKSRDEYADASWEIENPRFNYSVLTGRSLKEIKQAKPGKGSAAAKRHKRPLHRQSR
jgi:bifunctional non-homologous end joining protein LigD